MTAQRIDSIVVIFTISKAYSRGGGQTAAKRRIFTMRTFHSSSVIANLKHTPAFWVLAPILLRQIGHLFFKFAEGFPCGIKGGHTHHINTRGNLASVKRRAVPQ
jgi:hypothetical protein